MAKSWYVYMGGGDFLSPSSYGRITVKHDGLCGNRIHTIYATGENFHPDPPLSVNIQSYIKKALVTGEIQPEIPAGSQKYVYLKYVEK